MPEPAPREKGEEKRPSEDHPIQKTVPLRSSASGRRPDTWSYSSKVRSRDRERPTSPHHVRRLEAHLGDLDLLHEARAKVLDDDAVRGSEEGEDVLDEVLLIIRT